MSSFVRRDGQLLTPWMNHCINNFSNALHAKFGVRILVSSGIRTAAEQEAIFRRRYRVASQVNGRRVYDTRVWRGVRWYRIDPAGTVAVPGTSNHEIQGSRAAADLRDTGRDAGITVRGTARANWARANAWRYGLNPSGYGFGEPWHFDIPGIYQSPPRPAKPAKPAKPAVKREKEDEMTQAVRLNKKHHFVIGEEFISHSGTVAQNDIARKVNTKSDELHELNTKQFNDYLDAMGIPRSFVNLETGAVLNPQSGKLVTNGVWSRRREAVAKLDALLERLPASEEPKTEKP